MFQGCSGVVPGCSGLFQAVPGVFRGCSGGVPGCSGVFRGVPGFTDTHKMVSVELILVRKTTFNIAKIIFNKM